MYSTNTRPVRAGCVSRSSVTFAERSFVAGSGPCASSSLAKYSPSGVTPQQGHGLSGSRSALVRSSAIHSHLAELPRAVTTNGKCAIISWIIAGGMTDGGAACRSFRSRIPVATREKLFNPESPGFSEISVWRLRTRLPVTIFLRLVGGEGFFGAFGQLANSNTVSLLPCSTGYPVFVQDHKCVYVPGFLWHQHHVL